MTTHNTPRVESLATRVTAKHIFLREGMILLPAVTALWALVQRYKLQQKYSMATLKKPQKGPFLMTSIFTLFIVGAKAVSGQLPHLNMLKTNVTVMAGHTAILPCSVDFLGEFKVVWVDAHATLLTFAEQRIISDERISVERPYLKDWNLHVRYVRPSDEGFYSCQVNTNPVQVNSVFLKVQVEGPEFLDHTSEVTAVAGTDAVLPCDVRSLKHYKVVWVSPKKVVISIEDRRMINDMRMSVERPFLKDWNLHIRDVTPSDQGEYLCKIGTSPVMSKSVSLKVTAPGPQFLETASNVTATEGSTAVLPCAVAGLGLNRVVWRRYASNPLTIGEVVYTGDDRITLRRPSHTDWNLVIRDVKLSDSGKYRCQLSSSGMVKSVFLTITVPGQDGRGQSTELPDDGHDAVVLNGSLSVVNTAAAGRVSVSSAMPPLACLSVLVGLVQWL